MPILKSTALSRELPRRKRKLRSFMTRIGMPATLLSIPIAFFLKRTPLPWKDPGSGWICRGCRLLPSASKRPSFDICFWSRISCPRSFNAQAVLHLLQCDSLGLRVKEQHDEKLYGHHDCKENERVSAGRFCQLWKRISDKRIHDPVRRASQCLSLCAHAVGKDFADVDPDNRALRNCEEGDVAYQQPQKIASVTLREEYAGDTGQTRRRPHRSD